MSFLMNSSSVLSMNGYYIHHLNGQSIQQRHSEGYRLAQMVDFLGCLSAKAQNLKFPITSRSALSRFPQHDLYLLTVDSQAIGFIKTGMKQLYLHNDDGQVMQCQVPCVLDFYVQDCHQRQGHGKRLFEYALEQSHWQPEQLAYDRPSPKLISFLRKYYRLQKEKWLPSRFVMYQATHEKLIQNHSMKYQRTDKLPSLNWTSTLVGRLY